MLKLQLLKVFYFKIFNTEYFNILDFCSYFFLYLQTCKLFSTKCVKIRVDFTKIDISIKFSF